jgi:hypothetical protein
VDDGGLLLLRGREATVPAVVVVAVAAVLVITDLFFRVPVIFIYWGMKKMFHLLCRVIPDASIAYCSIRSYY